MQDVRHDVRYVGVLPAWNIDYMCHVCVLCANDVGYVKECISTLSKRKVVCPKLAHLLPFSSVCVIVNSLCPTFHKYILSMLRLSIDVISGSEVRICYTPILLIKSMSIGRITYPHV